MTTPTRHRAPGAGRPRKGGKRYQVRLPDELAAYLRETGGGEIAAGIVRLYNEYCLLARVLPQVAAALPVGESKVREGKMEKDFNVIFDNGGGITLQVGETGYVHYYSNPEQAAEDVRVLMESGSTEDWDGDEPEARIPYKMSDVRNGGYIWHNRHNVEAYSQKDLWTGDDAPASLPGWRNVFAFYKALSAGINE